MVMRKSRANSGKRPAKAAAGFDPVQHSKDCQEHFDSVPADVRAKINSLEGATNAEDMRIAAESVLAMSRTIRDLLPVEGASAVARDFYAIEWAHNKAAAEYTAFERVRNPLGFPWPGPKGSFSCIGSHGGFVYYMNLCSAMEQVCEHYGWQGLSKLHWIDGRSNAAQRPHCNVRNGIQIPPIAQGMLDHVERTARGLLAEVEATDDGDLTNSSHGCKRKATKRLRGRERTTDHKADERLYTRWKASGFKLKEFAPKEGLTFTAAKRIMNRHRTRIS